MLPRKLGARNIYDPDHVKAKNLWYSVLAEPQKTDRLEIGCWRTHLTTRHAAGESDAASKAQRTQLENTSVKTP